MFFLFFEDIVFSEKVSEKINVRDNMKKTNFIIILLLTFFSAKNLICQHTVTYSVKIFHPGDQTFEEITSGTFNTGGSFSIPSYSLANYSDLEPYQSLYDVVATAPFGIQLEALTENISISLNMISFNTESPGQYFDPNLFLFMRIDVVGEISGTPDPGQPYPLQNGKFAFLRLPVNSNLINVLSSIGTDTSNIQFAYYANGAYDLNGISYVNTGDFIECRLTHFSKFGGGKHGALPVELTEFKAVLINRRVNLSWKTATEVNNYGFEIERSQFLKDDAAPPPEEWGKIGFVSGHGNSNSPKEYSFKDNISELQNLPQNECIGYRLKQIDFDGSYEYSKVVTVSFDKLVCAELRQNYPNPFNPTTIIEYSVFSNPNSKGSFVNLSVYNVLGELVRTLVNEYKQAGRYSVEFNADGLPSGIYYYKLTSDSEIIVKQMELIK